MRVPISNKMKPRLKHLPYLRVLLPAVGIEPRPSSLVGGVRPSCANHPDIIARNFCEQLTTYFALCLAHLTVSLEMSQHFQAKGYDRPLLLGPVAQLKLWM